MTIDDYTIKTEQIIDGIRGGAFIPADLEENEVIYHYTSLDGLKGILDSGVMHVTDFHYLNDETEFQYVYDLLIQVLEEEFRGIRYYGSFLLSVHEYLMSLHVKLDDLQNSFFVASFSKKQDNLTLWAEFASYGCNMGVNHRLLFADYGGLHYIGPVIYDLDEQKLIIREAIRTVLEHFFSEEAVCNKLKGYVNGLNEQQLNLLAVPIVELVYYYGMRMKNPLYKAEEECRMVFSAKDKCIKFKRKNNLFVPYIEIPLNMEHQFDALQSVTLAPLCRGTLERKSLLQYLQSCKINNADVKESEIILRY